MKSVKKYLLDLVRDPANKCAELLDSCGSESEFRLRCLAAGKNPEEVFRPYGEAVAAFRGYLDLGLPIPEFRLSDWWAFEKIPGANKPDPWMNAFGGKPGKLPV